VAAAAAAAVAVAAAVAAIATSVLLLDSHAHVQALIEGRLLSFQAKKASGAQPNGTGEKTDTVIRPFDFGGDEWEDCWVR
jgi:hypothetical protein